MRVRLKHENNIVAKENIIKCFGRSNGVIVIGIIYLIIALTFFLSQESSAQNKSDEMELERSIQRYTQLQIDSFQHCQAQLQLVAKKAQEQIALITNEKEMLKKRVEELEKQHGEKVEDKNVK